MAKFKDVKIKKVFEHYGNLLVDNEGVSEVNGSLEKLGVCSYHFNHDQNKLHDSNFKKKNLLCPVFFACGDVSFVGNSFTFLVEEMVVQNIHGNY